MPTSATFRPSRQQDVTSEPPARGRRFGARVAAVVTLLAVLAVLAASCTGEDEQGSTAGTPATDGTTSTTSETAAGGPRATGTGYNFGLPSGWRDATARAKAIDARLDLLVTGKVTERFATNANVVIEPSRGASLTDYVAAAREQLEPGLKARLLGESEQLSVAGTPAATYEYTFTQNGTPIHASQVLMVRGDNAYVLTFSAHEQAFSDDKPALDQIVASWSWI